MLTGAVRGISDIIKRPGMINVDFADVRTVMSEMGMAMMGTGRASGPNRAREATEEAIRNPLLDDVNLQGARGILVNITSGPDLSIGEYSEVGQIIEGYATEEATVKVGTAIDPDMRDELHVTVVVTGLNSRSEKPVKVIDNTVGLNQAVDAIAGSVVTAKAVGDLYGSEYSRYEKPAIQRNAGVSAGAPRRLEDSDYLDLPTFLRNQAD